MMNRRVLACAHMHCVQTFNNFYIQNVLSNKDSDGKYDVSQSTNQLFRIYVEVKKYTKAYGQNVSSYDALNTQWVSSFLS